MHNFDELAYRSTEFTLNALEEVNSKVMEAFKTSASTSLIKNLQMVKLQKSILAIGMFSLFESILQERLACANGFENVKKILTQIGKVELYDHFDDYICAINVVKHGQGRSYDKLVAKPESLPFKLKLQGGTFFYEGDISEISTLIEVDDKFVLNSALLIEEISTAIRSYFR